ncbi:MAG: NTP transferase domain-containing protein [Thiotrichales bacterium]
MNRGIVGVLLAAGASSRFGDAKLLQRLPEGELVAVASVRGLREALPDSLVVTRIDALELARALHDLGLTIILSAVAAKGMGHSLACGVRSSANAQGWVVALADMPLLRSETVAAVAAHLRQGASIVAPTYRGQRGHPVGFDRRFFHSLTALEGDVGARHLLQRHARDLTLVEIDDPGILRDIDVPADLSGTARG